MSDEGMMVGGGGFDILSRLGHGDALHKEGRREIESLRSRLAEYESLLAKAGEAFTEGSECIDDLRSRLAAAERQRDEALVTLKTMLVADMTRNRDLWIKTWAKVPALTAGVQIDAHLAAAREGEK